MNEALLLLAAFQAKQFLADFVLQSGSMVRNKGIYGRPGGLAHAAIHAGLSGLILAALPLPAATLLALILGEFAVHYHLDWAKERLARALALTPARPGFWRLLGFDQLLHHLTNLAMAAIALSEAAR